MTAPDTQSMFGGRGGINRRKPRALRGRVLAMGESPLMEELAAGLDKPPIRVGNVFDAMGEISLSTAAEPVACVVTTAEALGEDVPQAVRAIRRVDPSVKLVLLRHGAGENGLRSEFDACLAPPLDAGAIERALDPTTDDRNDEDMASEQPLMTEPQRQPEAIRPAADIAPPREAPAASAPITPPPRPAEALAHGGQLGDTDLVEAVLADDGLLPARALAVIAHHTGWADLQFIAADQPAPPGAAEIRFEDKLLGWLHGADVPAAGLRPWADWLARWIALDCRQRDLREMAFTDDLTGAGSRRYFNQFLSQAMAHSYETRRAVTVMVCDIDDFKLFNDRFGHAAGDEILCETVRLLNSVIRKGDRVFRIGGDEFAVVFADPEAPREAGSAHPESAERIAWRFQDQICQMKFPKLGVQAPGNLSISAGLATYPWDGHDPKALLKRADQRALESKRGGKNAFTFGPGIGERCRRGPRG